MSSPSGREARTVSAPAAWVASRMPGSVLGALAQGDVLAGSDRSAPEVLGQQGELLPDLFGVGAGEVGAVPADGSLGTISQNQTEPSADVLVSAETADRRPIASPLLTARPQPAVHRRTRSHTLTGSKRSTVRYQYRCGSCIPRRRPTVQGRRRTRSPPTSWRPWIVRSARPVRAPGPVPVETTAPEANADPFLMLAA